MDVRISGGMFISVTEPGIADVAVCALLDSLSRSMAAAAPGARIYNGRDVVRDTTCHKVKIDVKPNATTLGWRKAAFGRLHLTLFPARLLIRSFRTDLTRAFPSLIIADLFNLR